MVTEIDELRAWFGDDTQLSATYKALIVLKLVVIAILFAMALVSVLAFLTLL